MNNKLMNKYWNKLEEEKRLCNEWLKEPLINPETGKSIVKNGPIYNKWKEKCKELGLKNKPINTKQMTWKKCQEWKKNPEINPETGKKLKINGPTYKRIEKQCLLIREKQIEIKGEYYKPDKNGMVPCIKINNINYVIRRYNNRNVYGPLNKWGKNIKLCYYSDNWDYKHNYYKPIYLNGKPPINNKLEKNNFNKLISKNKKENPKYIVDNIIKLFIK
jgi:hypothetical protein